MKISDNNIENIFNINIYINGVFSNNIEQDIITILLGLMNQQAVSTSDGSTLKDKLIALAEKQKSKDVSIDVPASSMGQSLNFDGLAAKIQEALTNRSEKPSPSVSSLESKAKELLDQYKKGGDIHL